MEKRKFWTDFLGNEKEGEDEDGQGDEEEEEDEHSRRSSLE